MRKIMDSENLIRIRDLFWEMLKTKWDDTYCYREQPSNTRNLRFICSAIYELAKKRELTNGLEEENFIQENKRNIEIVLWEFISQGLLYVDICSDKIGTVGYADKITFDITDYGKEILKSEVFIPHDPEGYLSCLREKVPNVDEVIYTYIRESIHAYNKGLMLSATTMVGCASEKAFLLLLEAFINYLPTNDGNRLRQSTHGKFIKNQFEEFRKKFNVFKSEIKCKNLESFDTLFSGIFEVIRQNRNEVGHPSGIIPAKHSVFASLQIFIPYLENIYMLIEYFNSLTDKDLTHLHSEENAR